MQKTTLIHIVDPGQHCCKGPGRVRIVSHPCFQLSVAFSGPFLLTERLVSTEGTPRFRIHFATLRSALQSRPMSLAADEGPDRAGALDAELARERQRSSRLSAARAITFAAALAGVALALFSSPWAVLWLALPALVLFAVLILRHGAVRARIAALEAEALLIRERAERVGGRRRERPVPEPFEEYGRGLESPPPQSFPLEAGVLDDLNLLS